MAVSKNATIEKFYYKTFGSIKEVFKDAKAIDPTIKEKKRTSRHGRTELCKERWI